MSGAEEGLNADVSLQSQRGDLLTHPPGLEKIASSPGAGNSEEHLRVRAAVHSSKWRPEGTAERHFGGERFRGAAVGDDWKSILLGAMQIQLGKGFANGELT